MKPFQSSLGTAHHPASDSASRSTGTSNSPGDIWYYYGSRYGEYFPSPKARDPEDYLPSLLENRPGEFAQAYLSISRAFYEDSGDPARASRRLRTHARL